MIPRLILAILVIGAVVLSRSFLPTISAGVV